MEVSREKLFASIVAEESDASLAAFREIARKLSIHLHIGSLAVKATPDKAANRGLLIDPRGEIVARYDKIHMDRVAFEEMLEFASLGAKVLQVRSVELGMLHKVKIFVRSSFDRPEDIDPHGTPPGTLICDEEDIVEQQTVTGIAFSKDEAQISVRHGRGAVTAVPARRAGSARRFPVGRIK